MHLTVFGATSSTGAPLVEQALARGHHVTAHTRDAARVALSHPHLRVVAGDVTDPDDCRRALEGADVAVVTLGAGRKGVVREAGTRAVATALQATGVRRLVVQSTIGTGESREHLTFYWRRLMFGALLRQAYLDHVRQEELVQRTDLDWTIVRPSAFTDADQPGVRHGFGTDATGLSLRIGRAQVADFLLEVATTGAYARRAVSLSA